MELALVLPLVVMLLLALVQGGVTIRDQILLTHAAREAARAASLDDDRGAIDEAAQEAGPLDDERLQVRVTGRDGPGSQVTVTLTYDATRVPLVSSIIGSITLNASASMRVER